MKRKRGGCATSGLPPEREASVAKDSIFSPAFGNRPSQLVGREGIVNDLLQGLGQKPGSKERSVVLLGQRGSGKTVLLWELADRAADLGFVVAAPTIVSEDMPVRIVEKIQDAGEPFVKKHSSHLSGGSVGPLGFSAGLQFTREVEETKSFGYKLTQLVRACTECGHGVLILVDELQANSPEVRQLVTAYQEIIGEGLDIALVMAGLPGAVSATLNDHVLTFLNRASKMSLPPLSFGDVDAFYQSAFNELGLCVSEEYRHRAAKATEGSPYLLQLVGHNIVTRVPEEGELSEEELEGALSAARIDYENDVCSTTLAALSEVDVSFLRAMSQDDGPSKMSDVADRMGVSPDYAQKYRRRLIDAGVIEPAGRGRVAFAVPFLADHLRRGSESGWYE